jgi:hypothetical protein
MVREFIPQSARADLFRKPYTRPNSHEGGQCDPRDEG